MCEAARSARPDQRMFLSLRAGDELVVNIRSQSVVFALSEADDKLLLFDILITIMFGFIFETVRFKKKERNHSRNGGDLIQNCYDSLFGSALRWLGHCR